MKIANLITITMIITKLIPLSLIQIMADHLLKAYLSNLAKLLFSLAWIAKQCFHLCWSEVSGINLKKTAFCC